MKALVFERNLPRYGASRLASVFGSGRGAGIGPLQLLDVDPPELPGEGWYRLRPVLSGICGSDLATLDGRSSRYFEDVVSFPFVPGHEVVGILDDGGVDHTGASLPAGTRAVIEPVLGCAPRNIEPHCPACATGHTGLCGNLALGDLAPGLQTGFCADTGGGWSTAGLVAHAGQLYVVPDSFSDEDAVLIEPTACAVHAALGASITPGDTVAVLGAGTLGLATVAALHQVVRPTTPCTVLVGAKYPHQRKLAEALGADTVVPPEQLPRAVRRESGSLVLGGRLTGGADVVFDCVGSAESLTQSMAMVRPRGRVVLVGMPGKLHIDLAPLWHREIQLVGAYAYGVEQTRSAAADRGGADRTGADRSAADPSGAGQDAAGPTRRTFAAAMDVVDAAGLGSLVSATYPLDRYEEAVAHAGAAGRRGAVKVAFDLRNRKGPSR
ncbi:MAG TPA: zinc-binding dehydrogenase [Acidimicrobiales bacterium]|nr:zinc-binding dehydrogenase [Acidimicrobiales bacterium]